MNNDIITLVKQTLEIENKKIYSNYNGEYLDKCISDIVSKEVFDSLELLDRDSLYKTIIDTYMIGN
jgi:hypothetical protein